MVQHIVIITGASRGLGQALAQQLLRAGHDLLCISRRHNDALGLEALQSGRRCEQWAQDLAEAPATALRLQAWLAAQDGTNLRSVTLINNAAMLPRIAPLVSGDSSELSSAMRVNLEAPMLLTCAFLQGTREWKAARKVLNISSGLGRRAMASQAAYCAAKAGMDHFTRCLALEEALVPNGAKVCSLAPGVIDTDMQVHMRSADAQQFPDVDNFIGLKQQGLLDLPSSVAAKLMTFLASPRFGDEPVADIRGWASPPARD